MIVIDGTEGKQYESVGKLVFSPDSKRLVYGVNDDGRSFIVLDGIEGKKYDADPLTIFYPVFSPNSSRVAHFALLSANQGYVAVVDGVESKPYMGVQLWSLVFSPDSKRVAYFVFTDIAKGFVVVDGKENKQYTGTSISPIFSPDSKRLVYVAKAGGKEMVVLDDTEGKQYDEIINGSLVFSPDSQRVAYVARSGKRQFAVIDGIEGEQYDTVGKIIFSPDSQRIAYSANAVTDIFMVIDEVKMMKMIPYTRITQPIFSPDSQRVAYFAFGPAGKGFLVTDNLVTDRERGETYDNVGTESLTFSPDGKRLAYSAYLGNEWCVVVDGVEGQKYDPPVLIGKERMIFFDSSDSLHYLAQRGNRIYLVEEKWE